MKSRIFAGMTTLILLLMTSDMVFCTISSGKDINGNNTSSLGINNSSDLDINKITTSWNLSLLYPNKDAAKAELARMRNDTVEMNRTYRPLFVNLTGAVLLDYIRSEENFSKSLDVLSAYATAGNSLDVNDKFFEVLLSDAQNLSTEHDKNTSFAEVKLKSLPKAEWERLFVQEPELGKYRAYFEANYIRYADHRPKNESQAALLADLNNKLMKLDTKAGKLITNNVTQAGNITLGNGTEYAVDSQSYYDLLYTDQDRGNRKKVYDKRYNHLVNESEEMGKLYVNKSMLDDMYARELNFSDAYEAKMFDYYLNASQIDEMNEVFKERRGDFDGYYEFRMALMGQKQLWPYDLFLQLMKDPNKKDNYTNALRQIGASFSKMDPQFNQIFIKTATSNSVDVYPNPGHGKQSNEFTEDLFALKKPALIFLNYKGLIDDKRTIAHEMGHAINMYLMENSVDFLYCGGPMYEAEVPSTFDEELFVDYAVKNYDKDTAVAVLADQINNYANYFTFQTMITEFEHKAHQLISQKKGNVRGTDLDALWTSIDKEYRNSKVSYYNESEQKWTYVEHIYFATDNYYTFNYALSKAITLSLFKRYQEDPKEFNKNYIAYLSAGTTMTPPEKLKKYFGLEINRKLFEDAMDMVDLRVKQLIDLEKGGAA